MKKPTISQKQAELHETTSPLLQALYREMQELGKKKPEATLSASKVKVINRLLEDVRIVLKDEPELKYLDLIDSDALPQHSDIVLMLSQYTSAMKTFAETYYGYDWATETRRWAVSTPLKRNR